jgi:hypothetical protein
MEASLDSTSYASGQNVHQRLKVVVGEKCYFPFIIVIKIKNIMSCWLLVASR